MFIIRQALMLSSILIKVKTQDGAGRGCGGLSSPTPAPPLHKSAAGAEPQHPRCGEETGFEELGDERPGTHTPKRAQGRAPPKHTYGGARRNPGRVKGSGKAGDDGKMI